MLFNVGVLLGPIHRYLERKVGKNHVRREIQRFGTDRRTLDIGCGQSPSAEGFPNRVGIDVVPATGVHVLADAHTLPFASCSFEQIICSEVLEHLVDPQRAVQEMARVLVDEGHLVLTVPFVYPVHESPHDYQRLTSYGLSRLFCQFFEIDEIKELFTEEQTLAILLQRIAFQRRDSPLMHYAYLFLAHIVFRFSPVMKTRRYQDISGQIEGPFLTAGYLLLARKKKR